MRGHKFILAAASADKGAFILSRFSIGEAENRSFRNNLFIAGKAGSLLPQVCDYNKVFHIAFFAKCSANECHIRAIQT